MSDSATTPTQRNRPETAGIIALLLEQGPEEGFDRLTRLATMALRTPTAVLGLLSGPRLLAKSHVGMPAPWELDPNEPLPHAMFRHALATSKPFVVEDLRRHPLTKDMVLSEGWEHAAYCGVPIILANRKTVGVLAVFDPKPRPWTDREIGFLQDLAASAGQEIEDRMEPIKAVEVIPDEALELLSRAPDGFLSIDAEWRVTLVNSAAERILRRAANELMGMPLASIFPGVTGGAFQSGLERAFAEPGGVAFEDYCRSLHAWLEARAFQVNGGLAIHLRDVSARRESEEALRHSEARYRGVFQEARDPMVFMAADGTLTECNRATVELFGYSREDLFRMKLQDLFADEAERDRLMVDLDGFGSVSDFAARIRNKNGSVLECAVSALTRRTAE
ncbi:MAG: PAS domain S-box protein, partial [Longimicrobiales bacterium]